MRPTPSSPAFILLLFSALLFPIHGYAQFGGTSGPCETRERQPCAGQNDVKDLAKDIVKAINGLTLTNRGVGESGASVDGGVASSIATVSQATAGGIANHVRAVDNAIKEADEFTKKLLDRTPTIEGCAEATMAQGVEFTSNNFLLQIKASTDKDVEIGKNGAPGGVTVYRKKYIEKWQEAAKKENPTYMTDLTMAKKLCATGTLPSGVSSREDCYNQALRNALEGSLALTAIDRPPVNAASNPQTDEYFAKLSQWQQRRAEARDTIARLLPKRLVSKSYYELAKGAYLNAGKNPATLASKFPYSDQVGLNEYELAQARYDALISPIRGASIQNNEAQNQRRSDLIKQYAAEIQMAKVEKQEFADASNTLLAAQVGLSASAISIK